ncbi:hypothetical protein NB069_11270 [Leclercia adecarboxylata]|uniref:hypothetical protein n=1 Tax=Leclercia adecarboxylata TaxID=83655 RepID=UPI00202A99D2|nr:hypothetical protein [Leclercia adecarboxylata]URO01488.1 hypothetical protein NB069_11270 [Leclercia adecarboxylata]
MEILSQNKFSSLGMLLGAIALVLGIVHFSLGPFSSPPPTLQSAIANQVNAVKKGITAGLKGEQPEVAENKRVNIDKILHNGGIALAVVALGLAFIGGMRKENRWGIVGALVFAGGTLMFHAALFGIGIVCAILLLFLIISFLQGTLSGL